MSIRLGTIAFSPFFFLLFFLLPSEALALSHHYVCNDFTYGAPANCVSDIFTPNGSGYIVDDTPNFNLTPGTWYVTFTNTGGTYRLAVNGTTYFLTDSASQSEYAFTSTMAGGFYMDDNGTISNLCIDDDGTTCTSAPPPPTIATSTYNCVTKDASSTDCLVQVVDYPVLDIFLGFVLFFAVIVGIVWFTTLIL